jgi:hypothetical protein
MVTLRNKILIPATEEKIQCSSECVPILTLKLYWIHQIRDAAPYDIVTLPVNSSLNSTPNPGWGTIGYCYAAAKFEFE